MYKHWLFSIIFFADSWFFRNTAAFFHFIMIDHISLGALGDSYYEYLLKVWLQSGRTDAIARRMYDDAMDAIVKNIIQTSASGLMYASDMKYERLEHKMDHLACFAGLFCLSFWLLQRFF